ncbi:MAG: SCO family protein [Mycobacteriales bacterium]
MTTYDRRSLLAGAVALTGLGAITACGSGNKKQAPLAELGPSSSANGLHGTSLNRPFLEPAVTLTDTAGKPFNLLTGTREKAITLVFFGYTHCSDVCPTTMADIAAALRRLKPTVRKRIATVFITTDPWRDKPAVIRSWLRPFDPSFIGLTGPFPLIQRAARQVAISVIEPKQRTGNYEVTHGAEVLVFTPDRLARLIYPPGVLPEEYAADLPKLVATADRQ